MLQCKIFSGKEITEIEKEVNNFFREYNKISVNSIHQSGDSRLLYITIFFHIKTKADKMKDAAIEEIKVPITTALEGNS